MFTTRFAAACVLLALVAGCSPAGPESASVRVADVEARPVAAPALSPAAEETYARLQDIAARGSVYDMARLAAATPDFRSNDGGLSHREYWYLKLRTGDWPMAHVGRVLDYPYAVQETDSGRIFVWPYMAFSDPASLDRRTERDIASLLGEQGLEAFRSSGEWRGYRLAIAEDGRWLYFYSGEG